MNIKQILAVGLLSAVALTACVTEDKSTVSASIPEGFTEVTRYEKNSIDSNSVTEIKHNITGCHYLVVEGTQSVAITPMYMRDQGNGVVTSIPYCN